MTGTCPQMDKSLGSSACYSGQRDHHFIWVKKTPNDSIRCPSVTPSKHQTMNLNWTKNPAEQCHPLKRQSHSTAYNPYFFFMWLIIKLFICWSSRALSVAEFDTDETPDTFLVLADSHSDLCCFASVYANWPACSILSFNKYGFIVSSYSQLSVSEASESVTVCAFTFTLKTTSLRGFGAQ